MQSACRSSSGMSVTQEEVEGMGPVAAEEIPEEMRQDKSVHYLVLRI